MSNTREHIDIFLVVHYMVHTLYRLDLDDGVVRMGVFEQLVNDLLESDEI